MAVVFHELVHSKIADDAKVEDVDKAGSQPQVVELQCCTLNIGSGDLELAHEPLRTRWPRQVKLLEEAKSLDILCLQELRRCADSSEPQPEDILYDVSKRLRMQTVYGTVNTCGTAFGQAIGFRHDRFFLKQTVQKWLDRNGEWTDVPGGHSTRSTTEGSSGCKGFSSMILAVELCLVHGGKLGWYKGTLPSFWVVCVQIPTDARVRVECTLAIDAFLASLKAPYIVMGDFNSFPRESTEQLAILCNTKVRLCVSSSELRTLDLQAATGTWYGYPKDKFMRHSLMDMPHLDHIAISALPGARVGTGTLLIHSTDLKAHTNPSDHVGLLAFVCLPLTERTVLSSSSSSSSRMEESSSSSSSSLSSTTTPSSSTH